MFVCFIHLKILIWSLIFVLFYICNCLQIYLLHNALFNKCLMVEYGNIIMKRCDPANSYQHWSFIWSVSSVRLPDSFVMFHKTEVQCYTNVVSLCNESGVLILIRLKFNFIWLNLLNQSTEIIVCKIMHTFILFLFSHWTLFSFWPMYLLLHES